MIAEHPFWWILVMACVAWYSTITIYVAIRGAADIKTMLTSLANSDHEPSDSTADPPKRS
jgi:hypothetical protein